MREATSELWKADARRVVLERVLTSALLRTLDSLLLQRGSIVVCVVLIPGGHVQVSVNTKKTVNTETRAPSGTREIHSSTCRASHSLRQYPSCIQYAMQKSRARVTL